MRGTAETPDLILSGEIGVNKTVNTESLNIYENGNYTPPAGVDGYDDIHVDVRPVIDQITIRENGTYAAAGDVDGYSPVVINVPQSAAKVYAKNINANGNYYPDAGYDGFSQVSVNVPETPLHPLNVNENGEYNPPTGEGYSKVVVDVPTAPEIDSITITENGTYTAPTGVDGYSPVIVNVPQPEDAYYIKDMTPGAIASFDDGADMVLPSLTASIVPVQSGSGDPSPTNVRPISGYTEANVWNGGKNYLNTIQDNVVMVNGGEAPPVISNQSITYNIPEGAYFFLLKAFKIEKCHVGKTYVMSYNISPDRAGYTKFVICNAAGSGRQEKALTVTITNTDVGKLLTVRFYPNQEGNFTITNIQVEEGSEPTTYEPYAGTTTTIPFTDSQGESVEVFGGSVDVVNGGGNAYKEYPSYNGETLIGPWISDRDVYAPNTTPTIGAQVVDMGDTTTFYTQPTAIKSLDGENNVFASTGDILSGSYFSETPA